jgi:hypothetical protein
MLVIHILFKVDSSEPKMSCQGGRQTATASATVPATQQALATNTAQQNLRSTGRDGSDAIPDAEVVVKSFEGFLSFILSVSIFGASIFTVIVSDIADPAEISKSPRFDRETVRMFLALAWLLFVVALGIAGFSLSVVTIRRERVRNGSDQAWNVRWKRLGLASSFVLQTCILGAFMFLSLAVVAYTEGGGWAAVACTSAACVVALIFLLWQCP